MNLIQKALAATLGLSVAFTGLLFADWKREPLPQINDQAATSRPDGAVRTPALLNEQQDVLQYDSGPKVFFPQQALAGSLWLVRFTPMQSCSLTAISVYSAGGGGTVKIHIFADSAGEPGRDLIAPFPVELGGDLTNQVIFPPAPVDAGPGDFYVAFELLADGPPYLTADDDGGSGHSSYFSPDGSRSEMSESDFAARAHVRYYGPDKIPPTLFFTPPDAAFAEDGLEITAQLSDPSGIAEAVVHYSVNGGAWAALPLQDSGGTYQAILPALEPGWLVRYYLEVKDGAELPNETFAPAAAPSIFYELPVYAGRQIKYDDGTAEDFFIAAENFDDNRFAVRLTPSFFPAQLHTLRAYVNDTSRFFLSVYSDSCGHPGRLLSGPWPAGLQNGGEGWVNFELPVSGRPVVEGGSVFLVLQWSPASPQQPGVGADAKFPDGRSLFYTEQSGWRSWAYGDWILRASYFVSKTDASRPARFSLGQNLPNPFNPATEIHFELDKETAIELSVYNVLGQKVRTLASGGFSAGEHSVIWDGRDERGLALSSGVYFYRLRGEKLVQTRRMVLIK